MLSAEVPFLVSRAAHWCIRLLFYALPAPIGDTGESEIRAVSKKGYVVILRRRTGKATSYGNPSEYMRDLTFSYCSSKICHQPECGNALSKEMPICSSLMPFRPWVAGLGVY